MGYNDKVIFLLLSKIGNGSCISCNCKEFAEDGESYQHNIYNKYNNSNNLWNCYMRIITYNLLFFVKDNQLSWFWTKIIVHKVI